MCWYGTLEKVGGPGFTGGGAISVFGDQEEGAGEDGTCGRNVESVVGIPTCADYVTLGVC